ncbi:MAG: transposase [Syntrophomonadaceae bacterium]|nr:transposase [Syntrophomonadaceae bacterium]
MYKAVAETIFELSQDKKYLRAQPGFFSILHTWGQDLHFHPHIHTVVLAGGLTRTNEWRSSGKKFFIPIKVLAKKFRGKFLYHLKHYYRENCLSFYGDARQYQDKVLFQKLLDLCYEKDWYTYAKEPFSGPLAVLKYLGRYTHRIAISNRRIVSVNNNTVTIAVKDYKNKSQKKTVTLTGLEFVRRFLMHILPKGFVKIRHYGILANRNKKTKLSRCRMLTNSSVYKPKFEGLTTAEIISLLVGRDVTLCPACKKGRLQQLSCFYHGTVP